MDGSIRELVAEVAGARSWSDNRKSWLSRAARRAGLSYRSVRALWYGEITDTSRAARLMRMTAERIAADREMKHLADKFEAMAARLRAKDADFHREDAASLCESARRLRGLSPGMGRPDQE